MNAEQMRGRGEQRFRVLELLHTMYLCPVLRSTLIRKTALKSPVFLHRIFLLIVIRAYLFDGQHAFLLLVKPVAVAWPSQRWMGKLVGGMGPPPAAVHSQAPPGVPHHHPPPPSAGGPLHFVNSVLGKSFPMPRSGYAFFTNDAAPEKRAL